MDIKAVVKIEDVPSDLILNWDHTGINIVPSSTWTMEAKGSKRVEAVGLNGKRQITTVFCASLSGELLPLQLSVELLPLQLIHQGKAAAYLPRFAFPLEWNVTYTTIIGLANRKLRSTSVKSFCHMLKQNVRYMEDLTRQLWSSLMNLKVK